ncbi:MAG: hypothetical protein OXU50_01750 [Gammaproteobacteria bacterium]|nr:hypothetical protein [Gammaproteobacteria bacterium]
MAVNFHIVTEGDEDVRFLREYLSFLGKSHSEECFKDLKGWGKLGGYTPDIEEMQDKGVKILIILDANSDHAKRRREAENILSRLNPPLFLFPDNKSAGSLDDLLLRITSSDHKDVLACLEKYEKCLRKSGYALFNAKRKVFAYKDAHGLHGVKGANQFDSKYWNYGHPALNPLKKFLTEHIGK